MKQYNETIEKLIHLKVISLADVLDYAFEYNMNQQLDYEMDEQQNCDIDQYDSHPEYVVASTSYEFGETLVFPSDKDGVISYYSQIASDYENLNNHFTCLAQLNTDEHSYHFVKRISDISSDGFYQSLFKKVKNG